LVGAQTASNLVSVTKRKFFQREVRLVAPDDSVSASAGLLRDVDLLFFVNVAEEIDQATNKGHCRQAECDPPGSVTTRRIRVGHKPVEVKDRPDGCKDAHDHREYIFKAFHVEPPAPIIVMKVKEKAEYLRQIMAAC
jgi:hypothetical protein